MGYGTTELGWEAFVWECENGMRNLAEVLARHGVELGGWTQLTQAVAISDDAVTIAGWGVNPQGDTEAWTATVPGLPAPCPPEALPMASGGGVAILIGLIAGLGARATRPAARLEGKTDP